MNLQSSVVSSRILRYGCALVGVVLVASIVRLIAADDFLLALSTSTAVTVACAYLAGLLPALVTLTGCMAVLGLVFDMPVLASATLGDAPRLVAFLGVALGASFLVAERRRLHLALREKRDELKIVADTLPAMLLYVDTRYRVRFANRASSCFVTVPDSELRGMHLRDALGQATFSMLEGELARAMAGESGHFDGELAFCDGKKRYVSVSWTPRLGASGRVEGCLGVVADVSARQNEVVRQRFLAEASSVLAGSLDYETTLAHVAELAVRDVVDWTAVFLQSPHGLFCVASVHRDEDVQSIADLEPRFAALLRESMDRTASELVGSDNGNVAAISGVASFVVAPILARGRALGVLVMGNAPEHSDMNEDDRHFAEDLARRAAMAIDNTRLYRHAQDAQRDAEQANRAKDEFLATLSHELRTPLNAILGWVQLFDSDSLTEQERLRGVKVIERNAKSQAQLIEDLLDVSRIVSGKLHLELEPVAAHDVLESAVAAVSPMAEAKGVQIVRRVDATAGQVLGDQQRLQQILWNLLSNAIKFSSNDGIVEVCATRVNNQVELAVTDHGAGISREFLPQVFDRFRQADASATRKHGGLGIGLAIVRHLVRAHGGTVAAESDGLGLGSTFRVRLPVLLATKRRPRVENDSDITRTLVDEAALAGLRVLVVEDDIDSRDLLKRILERCQSEVRTASSGREVLPILNDFKPDILVSDIGLPDEDGYELLKRIRELAPVDRGGVPAIALTAYASTHDMRRALAAGFQAHVAKPVEAAELLGVVARLTGRLTRHGQSSAG